MVERAIKNSVTKVKSLAIYRQQLPDSTQFRLSKHWPRLWRMSPDEPRSIPRLWTRGNRRPATIQLHRIAKQDAQLLLGCSSWLNQYIEGHASNPNRSWIHLNRWALCQPRVDTKCLFQHLNLSTRLCSNVLIISRYMFFYLLLSPQEIASDIGLSPITVSLWRPALFNRSWNNIGEELMPKNRNDRSRWLHCV